MILSVLRNALIGATFAAGAAAAAPIVSAPADVLPGTEAAAIAPVLAEAGFEISPVRLAGEDALLATAGDRKVILRPRVCAADGRCRGLSMAARIVDRTSPAITNLFNDRYPAARAVAADDSVVLSRYLIADHGVTRGSLAADVSVFAGMVDVWWEFRDGLSARTVSFEPLLETAPDGAAHPDEDPLATLLRDPRLGNQRPGTAPRDAR